MLVVVGGQVTPTPMVLVGLVAGSGLGPLRTGAIGGVAVDSLARNDATTLAEE